TRHRGGRRHDHGQAGPALPRRPVAGEGSLPDADVRLPGVRRVRDDRRGRAERLARPRAGRDGVAARFPARRRRRHPHLLRPGGRGAVAAVNPRVTSLPTIADVRVAAEKIAGAVLVTPFMPAPRLSALTGADVWVKYENLQA